MGKRKSSKPPPKKQRPKLATSFSCPFCNSDSSVTCQFDRVREVGTVACSVCQVRQCIPRNDTVEYVCPGAEAAFLCHMIAFDETMMHATTLSRRCTRLRFYQVIWNVLPLSCNCMAFKCC